MTARSTLGTLRDMAGNSAEALRRIAYRIAGDYPREAYALRRIAAESETRAEGSVTVGLMSNAGALPSTVWAADPGLGGIYAMGCCAHFTRREGDEYACSCGTRWGVEEGETECPNK